MTSPAVTFLCLTCGAELVLDARADAGVACPRPHVDAAPTCDLIAVRVGAPAPPSPADIGTEA